MLSVNEVVAMHACRALDTLQGLCSCFVIRLLTHSGDGQMSDLSSVCVCVCVQGLEVDTPEGLQRMSEWVFDFPAIYIGPTSVPPNGDLTNHLKTTLNQLTSLRTVPGVHVVFWGWGWTEPMARAVAQALPTLGHPNMGVKMPQLYETMETVMQMGES